MKTFNFKLFGGYTVKIDKTDVTVDYAGEKWLFITRAKPRTKTIVFDDILRVEYKESGSLAFGYVRFITKENEAYPSSSYVAQHDENAFMIEKDEVEKLNEVLDVLKKQLKNIQFVYMKA